MDFLSSFILIICFLIMLVGFFSIIFPLLPSIPLIWLGIFLYGVATGFEKINEIFVIIITIMMLAVVMLDYVTWVWGLREFKISAWAFFGAILGGYIGSFANPLAGLIAGALVGAVVAEILSGKDLVFAFRTKKYTIIGFIAGTTIKVAVAVSMIGLFIWQITR